MINDKKHDKFIELEMEHMMSINNGNDLERKKNRAEQNRASRQSLLSFTVHLII